MNNSPVKAIELTANRKVGPVSVTMASQSSCPLSCPFLKSGCYSESGPQGIHTAKLNNSEVVDPFSIATIEASLINTLSGTRPLRIHIVGDCTTDDSASIVSEAADNYTRKFNMPVWAYTHAHNVKRSSWKNVSVLRSCETVSQIKNAFADGYAASMVVSKFKDTKAYDLEDGIKGIPCPEQTGKAENCTKCKLCWKDNHLIKNKMVILFEAHGASKKKLLPMLSS